jgi:hypothetical protein
MPWGPVDPKDAAEEWRKAVVDGRRQGSALQHYHEVRYEEMLADPEPVISGVLQWLELPVSPPITAAAVEEARRAVVVDPNMPEVAEGKWRDGLSPTALEVLTTVAGDALADLGYADASTPPTTTTSTRAPLFGGWARLRARRQSAPVDAERLFRNRLHAGNWLVNRFLSELARGRARELETFLDTDVRVRLVTSDMEYEGDGREARDRLLETLEADPVFQWPQRRGQVLAGVPTTTIYLFYAGPDGATEQRVLSLTVNADRISGVSYFKPGSA